MSKKYQLYVKKRLFQKGAVEGFVSTMRCVNDRRQGGTSKKIGLELLGMLAFIYR